MAFARTVLHTKALARPSSGSEDKVYGVDYVSLTSHSEAVSGADVGGIPYCPTATTETTSANLTYSEASGPRLTVGSGATTNIGWILGYSGTSAIAALWPTSVTPGATNYVLMASAVGTIINSASSTGAITFRQANSDWASIGGTSGQGLRVFASTATTDVQALSATQTVNAAGVAFKSFKYSVTYTASAAGTLHSEWNGGAAGSTQLMALTKEGVLSHIGIAFASLPTGAAGMVAYITDSSTATWGATIAGGGANKVLAFNNGTNWTVAGA